MGCTESLPAAAEPVRTGAIVHGRQRDRARKPLASTSAGRARLKHDRHRLIGSKWLSAADTYWRRRLDDPKDWVRREITVALNENKRILIVPVEDAPLPPAEALPNSLVALA